MNKIFQRHEVWETSFPICTIERRIKLEFPSEENFTFLSPGPLFAIFYPPIQTLHTDFRWSSPFKNEWLLYGIDYMTNHPKSSDHCICKFVFVMYQLSPPLPSPTPNKPYFILSSHPGDCINHWVELFQGQNFHNTTFFRTHRHPKPSEIYNNTRLLFVRKLLRQEITNKVSFFSFFWGGGAGGGGLYKIFFQWISHARLGDYHALFFFSTWVLWFLSSI